MSKRTGRIVRRGYIAIKKPKHPNADCQGYVFEHRYIMSQKIGRPLKQGEVVHHKDGDKQNNAVENLKLFSSPGEHTRTEHKDIFEKQRVAFKGKEPPNKNHVSHFCQFCNKEFFANPNRKRKFCTMDCCQRFGKGKRKSKKTEFKKGFTPWNKGKKTPLSTREKIRQSRLAFFKNRPRET